MGRKKLSQEVFLERSKKVHGSKYCYDKSVYVNNHTKVCITCPIHGDFFTTPQIHWSGSECPYCQDDTLKLTMSEFIERANLVHGNKYDYSKAKYVNAKTKISIICPIHGIFEQTPDQHLRGAGCPICKIDKQRLTQIDFITRANNIHNDFYDYSKAEYKNGRSKVIIVCPIHGDFIQEAHSHLKGNGCPRCASDKSKTLIYGFGINDTNDMNENSDAYQHWTSMIRRCYGQNPSPKHAIVCDEWRYFSKFKEWFNGRHVEGWHLDKDLFSNREKIYSPATCCLVPNEINALFRKEEREDDLPTGVYLFRDKKFVAHLGRDGKAIYLGVFDTQEEAFNAYREAKEAHIKEMAEKWKDKIEPRVYEAMMNYKVKITD